MRRLLAVLVVSAMLVLGMAACGGDDESSNGGDARVGETAAPAGPGEQAGGDGGDGGDGSPGARGRGSGSAAAGGPAEPAERGDRYRPVDPDQREVRGDGSIQSFGERAPQDEAEAAVAVAVGYHDARADMDWERACALMASHVRDQLAQLAAQGGEVEGSACHEVLGPLTAGVPRRALRQEARNLRFTEVRVQGDRAFAIFESDSTGHGTMPMMREGGQWRVAALAGSSL